MLNEIVKTNITYSGYYYGMSCAYIQCPSVELLTALRMVIVAIRDVQYSARKTDISKDTGGFSRLLQRRQKRMADYESAVKWLQDVDSGELSLRQCHEIISDAWYEQYGRNISISEFQDAAINQNGVLLKILRMWTD